MDVSGARFDLLVAATGDATSSTATVCPRCGSSAIPRRRTSTASVRGSDPGREEEPEDLCSLVEEDRSYVARHGLSHDGIREISWRHGIDRFDAVLIDGSEFTGPAILEDVHGSPYLILDDIRALKNHDNYVRLRRDPAYEMVERSWLLRNGYAVFRRRAA